jgi:hypothetical protein
MDAHAAVSGLLFLSKKGETQQKGKEKKECPHVVGVDEKMIKRMDWEAAGAKRRTASTAQTRRTSRR